MLNKDRIRPRLRTGIYAIAQLAAAACLSFGPLVTAQTPACQWYAGSAVNTLYARADAACRGYVYPGYPPGTWIFHHVQLNSATGGMCWMRYAPNPNPNYPPQNIFNVAVQSGTCENFGLCAVYPENSTFGCGNTVAELEAVVKVPDDPTRIFHQTQTCIARKSCDLRCQMDNCKWMERVIPDFVNPYLQKLGRWPEIEADCRQPPALPGYYGIRIRDRMCARAMAKYHIEVDLNAALFRTGCGSDGDWAMVFETIKQCTADTFNSIPYLPGSETVAGLAVHSYREETRARCQYNRQAVGKPPEIDSNLGGKQCF